MKVRGSPKTGGLIFGDQKYQDNSVHSDRLTAL